jgi:hypothetical protein
MKIYKRNPESLKKFIAKCQVQLNNKPWIDEVVCIGSVGDKGDVSSWRADIDLRFFFKPGFTNYLKMNFYLIYIRTLALIQVIPLDLYAYNNIDILSSFKKGEGILVLKDKNSRITKRYSDRVINNEK